MKIESQIVSVKPEFEPIKLTLTFETLDEAAQFYAIFCHTYIIDAIQQNHDIYGPFAKIAENIRRALDKKNNEIQNAQKKYHKYLCNVLQFKNYE